MLSGTGGANSSPGPAFYHGSIISNVVNTGVRVFSQEISCRKVRRIIEAGGRNWYWQFLKSPALQQAVAHKYLLMDRPFFNHNRLNGVRFRVQPLLHYVSRLTLEADSVDFP